MGEDVGKRNWIEVDESNNFAILYLRRKDWFVDPVREEDQLDGHSHEQDRGNAVIKSYIDLKELEFVDQYRWQADYVCGTGCLPYVRSGDKYLHVMLWEKYHGAIIQDNPDDKWVVDHINHWRHDNRLANLRLIRDSVNRQLRRNKRDIPWFDQSAGVRFQLFPQERRKKMDGEYVKQLKHSSVYVYNIYMGAFDPDDEGFGNLVMNMTQYLMKMKPTRDDLWDKFQEKVNSETFNKLLKYCLDTVWWEPEFL